MSYENNGADLKSQIDDPTQNLYYTYKWNADWYPSRGYGQIIASFITFA